ncbi:MAG: class I SAM-dependent methyltransferase [Anaerolineae bacterium]|jgi:ubiquinone/menaquinone biosynthesis C-methylase UbiE
MGWLTILLVLLGLFLLGLILYWQLIIAEGTYLGPRIVALMYDWSARAYERIKRFSPSEEQWFLGLPLARSLELVPAPLVLDVATGTGRLPRALLRQPPFEGRVIGLDLSRRMLREAVRRTAQFADRLTFIWQDASELPFRDGVFDAVTCLEALEFVSDPPHLLDELIRALRPGGALLVTNRVGPDARFLPRRAFPPARFEEMLAELPLEQIVTKTWQVDYNLIWAVKTGEPRGGGIHPLEDILRCPVCRCQLKREPCAFRCTSCGRSYPVAEDGVIEMAGSSRAQRVAPC